MAASTEQVKATNAFGTVGSFLGFLYDPVRKTFAELTRIKGETEVAKAEAKKRAAQATNTSATPTPTTSPTLDSKNLLMIGGLTLAGALAIAIILKR